MAAKAIWSAFPEYELCAKLFLYPIHGYRRFYLDVEGLAFDPRWHEEMAVRDIVEEGLWPLPQNALRHSYISYRLALIEDVAKVALEAGMTRKPLQLSTGDQFEER